MPAKTTTIEVVLDQTVKKNKFFHPVKSIELNRMELLKYAILAWEVPDHVNESDYNYLQSKVPAMNMFFEGFVEFTSDSIVNMGKGDRYTNLISEYLGVGIGLKYSTLLLKINPSKFKKINRPVKGKYLDYSTICRKKEYEIETKGTIGTSYSKMKKDVLDKKKVPNKNIHLRYGTIFLAKKKMSKANVTSKCVIVDDPPTGKDANKDDTYTTQLYSYAIFLSQLLDPKYYNKFIKRLNQGSIGRLPVPKQKFFGAYIFEGKKYFGEFFDYRLIVDQFTSEILANKKVREIFNILTERLGQTKFFIGLEENVIKAINGKNQEYLDSYEVEPRLIIEKFVIKFLDRDGILVVKSSNDQDDQIRKIFPEEEVERRLSLFINYVNREAHKCGAPCTSRGIEGKPCEKMTFRSRCYFHR